jgi:type II secretory pathway component PulF
MPDKETMQTLIDEIEIIEVAAKKKRPTASSVNKERIRARFIGKISVVQKIHFLTSLSRLLGGGVPVLKTLELSRKQIRDASFIELVQKIEISVREGKSMSQSMAIFPQLFKSYEISIMKAGELSGTVSECLRRLAEELRQQMEIKNKVREAITYPLFVLSMGLVTLFVVLLFVIPRLSLIYKDFGAELPMATRIVLSLSSAAPSIFIFLVLAIAAFVAYAKSNAGMWNGWLTGLPLFGSLSKKLQVTRSALLLGTLLQSGVPMRETLGIVTESAPEKKTQWQRVLGDVTQGKNLSQAMGHLSFMGEAELSLIVAGEESGSLPQVLLDISKSASEELSEEVRKILKILEPTLILLIGATVGFLVLSMLLPITEIDLLVGA